MSPRKALLERWMVWASSVAFKSPEGEELVRETEAFLAAPPSSPEPTGAGLGDRVQTEFSLTCIECGHVGKAFIPVDVNKKLREWGDDVAAAAYHVGRIDEREGIPFGEGAERAARSSVRSQRGSPMSPRKVGAGAAKRSVYHREVPTRTIDVYRVLVAFEVTDPNIAHAVKKLLCAGKRNGGKPIEQDVAEAIWTLRRWEEMRAEEKAGGAA